MRASICERTQREPLPYLRYMLSSQVRSASPNSLFSWLAPEGEDGPVEAPPDLLEGHAAEHHLRRPRDDAQRLRPGEQPPEDDSRDPVVLADHVAGIRDRGPVLDDRPAQVLLPGPVGRAVQEQLIEQVRSVPAAIQQCCHPLPLFAVSHTVPLIPWPRRPW